MKLMALAICTLMLPALAQAEEMYRWTDERGTVHYTNVEQNAPRDAELVETIVTVEVDLLPGASASEPILELQGGEVYDSGRRPTVEPVAAARRPFVPLPDAPRVYDEQRLRFGCFTAGVLYFGGFAHANDISPVLNCYPYRLGPQAWLNAAKAELAMREAGIDPRAMVEMYEEMQRYEPRILVP